MKENSILQGLRKDTNFGYTENGALAHKSTLDKVYDLFAFGGAYRQKKDADVVNLFTQAYQENKELALKCLFYLRDARGGQGERRFFRLSINWLANNDPEVVKKNIDNISFYGRWDDLFSLFGTKLEDYTLFKIKEQLVLDMDSKTPSLLGKWMPSENASSYNTIKTANKIRKYLKLTHKQYRLMLSDLRKKINIVERLMSANKWEEIEFDKIPSKAGLIYKNAFARRDLIAKKYKEFIKSENTKVNAKVLYPYEVVYQATQSMGYWGRNEELNDTDRLAIEKYWNALPNYFKNDDGSSDMLCVIDTSGSMTTGSGAAKPINVAIGLGIYAAERMKGAFKDYYISFSSKPQLIHIEGVDFVDKVERIYDTNLCENTNLEAVFDLLLNQVLSGQAKASDLPKVITVISDMQIDSGTGGHNWYGNEDYGNRWTTDNAKTLMEQIRKKWNKAGVEIPDLVYWNVNASQNTILDLGPNVSYCSGASANLFEMITKGIRGIDLMLAKLNNERYAQVQI